MVGQNPSQNTLKTYHYFRQRRHGLTDNDIAAKLCGVRRLLRLDAATHQQQRRREEAGWGG